MVGELITLPLRLSLRASRVAMRSGLQVSEQAFNLAASAAQVVTGRASESSSEAEPDTGSPQQHSAGAGDNGERGEGQHGEAQPVDPRTAAAEPADAEARRSQQGSGNGGAPAGPPRVAPPPREPEADAAAAVERQPEPPTLPAEPPRPEEPGPTHVTEEARVVESLAEPGAEDGAGAQLTIGEPWPGYTRLSAREVIARVGSASAAELAAVDLFERTHKNRETVVAAVERKLDTESGNRPAADETQRSNPDDGR